MDENFALALQAIVEWADAEYDVFKDFEENHPRKLAKYSETRIGQTTAALTRIAAEHKVNVEKLRAALTDELMDRDMVRVGNVGFVGIGPRR
ncbi:hypothetical protein HFO56_23950 [Rhizobium laguerreae]|uniref:hypothetical protein n=1 Tax=Rhizobium laguerreae TaxID=1076926 RepID=UPI001C910970|nr:hypothetical protein [Rhizobium laguerreae]MBY3155382.1 hypothetical protein [Rhizobium laguerreae]